MPVAVAVAVHTAVSAVGLTGVPGCLRTGALIPDGPVLTTVVTGAGVDVVAAVGIAGAGTAELLVEAMAGVGELSAGCISPTQPVTIGMRILVSVTILALGFTVASIDVIKPRARPQVNVNEKPQGCQVSPPANLIR